jgi:hypothetical protein
MRPFDRLWRPGRTKVIKNFTLINGPASRREAAMVVVDGRIDWVGPQPS